MAVAGGNYESYSNRDSSYVVGENAYPQVLRQALLHASNVNAVDRKKRTALHLALAYRYGADVVMDLLEKGADICAEDMNSLTPLHYATLRRTEPRPEVIRCVLKFAHASVGLLWKLGGYRELGSGQYKDIATIGALSIRSPAMSQLFDQPPKKNITQIPYKHNALPKKDHVPPCTSGGIPAEPVHPVQGIQELLDRGADVNFCEPSTNQTALHCAISNIAPLAEVKMLIAGGGNIHILDNNLETPVHRAVKVSGENPIYAKKIIDILLASNVNAELLFMVGGYGQTDTTASAATPVTESQVKHVLDKGANIHFKDPGTGRSVLHCAIANRCATPVILLLLKRMHGLKTTSVNDADPCNKTPLHYATEHGEGSETNNFSPTAVVRALLKHANKSMQLLWVLGGYGNPNPEPNQASVARLLDNGADVHFCEPGTRKTALHCAVSSHAPASVITLLMDKGSSVHTLDANLDTPLHHAGSTGLDEADAAVITALVSGNPDAELLWMLGGYGQNPGVNAVTVEKIQTVLDKGANAGFREPGRGISALVRALESHQPYSVIRFLLRSGCDVQTPYNIFDSRTALHCAVQSGADLGTIQAILKHGCDVEKWHWKMHTVLHCATKCHANAEVVAALLSNSNESMQLLWHVGGYGHNQAQPEVTKVKKLVNAGANPVYRKSAGGKSSLDYISDMCARKTPRWDLLASLMCRGLDPEAAAEFLQGSIWKAACQHALSPSGIDSLCRHICLPPHGWHHILGQMFQRPDFTGYKQAVMLCRALELYGNAGGLRERLCNALVLKDEGAVKQLLQHSAWGALDVEVLKAAAMTSETHVGSFVVPKSDPCLQVVADCLSVCFEGGRRFQMPLGQDRLRKLEKYFAVLVLSAIRNVADESALVILQCLVDLGYNFTKNLVRDYAGAYAAIFESPKGANLHRICVSPAHTAAQHNKIHCLNFLMLNGFDKLGTSMYFGKVCSNPNAHLVLAKKYETWTSVVAEAWWKGHAQGILFLAESEVAPNTPLVYDNAAQPANYPIADFIANLVSTGADPELLLLGSAECDHAGIARALLNHHNTTGQYSFDNFAGVCTAKSVGEASSVAAVRQLFFSAGSFCGQYKLAKAFDFKSQTSVVHRAVNFSGQEVAIKFMQSSEHYVREVAARGGVNGDYVVPILAKSGDMQLPAADFRDQAARLGYGHQGIVMDAAVRNLAVASLQENMEIAQIIGVMKEVARCLHYLHQSCGRIHGDIKMLNIMRTIEGKWKLIDLDASALIDIEAAGTKFSSAYSAPELARFLFVSGAPQPIADGGLDIWAYGVVFFELITGEQLFPRSMRNDNLTTSFAKQKLCIWRCPGEAILAKISTDPGSTARHLINWCLQGDPALRPSANQLLSHPFLTSAFAPSENVLVNESLPELQPLTHVFISHMQTEANGEAARLAQGIEACGGTAWLDMKASDLTVEGMKRGVLNAACFILLLTSNVLTRPYCLLEILTAMQANKPIIILAEEDPRFYMWQYSKWKQNKVYNKDAYQWEAVKAKDHPGPYDTMSKALGNHSDAIYFSPGQHAKIRDMIEEHALKSDIMPIRRRDFEVHAMVLEIMRRTHAQLITSPTHHAPHVWKLPCENRTIPKPILDSLVVRIVFDPGCGDVTATALEDSFSRLGVHCTRRSDKYTHSIVVLTENILTTQSQIILEIVASKNGYIFLFCDSWDFRCKERKLYPPIDAALNDNEAMAYRPTESKKLRYEHDAMMNELLARLVRFTRADTSAAGQNLTAPIAPAQQRPSCSNSTPTEQLMKQKVAKNGVRQVTDLLQVASPRRLSAGSFPVNARFMLRSHLGVTIHNLSGRATCVPPDILDLGADAITCQLVAQQRPNGTFVLRSLNDGMTLQCPPPGYGVFRHTMGSLWQDFYIETITGLPQVFIVSKHSGYLLMCSETGSLRFSGSNYAGRWEQWELQLMPEAPWSLDIFGKHGKIGHLKPSQVGPEQRAARAYGSDALWLIHSHLDFYDQPPMFGRPTDIVLAGNWFEIECFCDYGDFEQVYRANVKGVSDKHYAIKVMLVNYRDRFSSQNKTFDLQLKAIKSLRAQLFDKTSGHPHILPVFAVARATITGILPRAQTCGLVITEYASNGELVDTLMETDSKTDAIYPNAFNARFARYIIRQAIFGLERLLKNGFRYQNLRPENFCFDCNCKLVLRDLENVKDISEDLHEESISHIVQVAMDRGTARYLAPELQHADRARMRSKRYDSGNTDTWAIGRKSRPYLALRTALRLDQFLA